MPRLKRRKDGGYFVHAPGEDNPVNTFQISDRGVDIVKRSGRGIEEYFPKQLFFLLLDLGHLSTKGAGGPSKEELLDRPHFEGLRDELSDRSRVEVTLGIVDAHGVEQLYDGKAAEWLLTLFGLPSQILRPLVEQIAEAGGYSYETIVEMDDGERLLEIATGAHLHSVWLRDSASFETHHQRGTPGDREMLGTESGYVYLKGLEQDGFDFCKATMPDVVSDDLREKLSMFWGEGVGTAAFAALHLLEVRRRYSVEDGLVVPRSRLADFPVDLPPRSELTELYEAFQLLESAVEHVLISPEAGVTMGDGSPCDRWYHEIQERRTGDSETNGVPSLGSQQKTRVKHSVEEYRDCYGDGTRICDFATIEMTPPSEAELVRLFGFGIFEHGERVEVPVAPDSEIPLPVYPRTKEELNRALSLLDEFPSRPRSGSPQ